MLNDERRTVEENYTSATNSSNLRCEADRRTDVDVLIAAGCTPGILGAALMRLHSEWDGCAKPRAGIECPADGSMSPPVEGDGTGLGLTEIAMPEPAYRG